MAAVPVQEVFCKLFSTATAALFGGFRSVVVLAALGLGN